MRRQHVLKVGLVAMAVAVSAFVQVRAADLAGANEVLAEIEGMSVEARTVMAQVAGTGDDAAVVEAVRRAAAVDAALDQAKRAYADMEKAANNGEEEAASAAKAKLDAAAAKAKDALKGDAVPEVDPQTFEAWVESLKHTGGEGNGAGFSGPNMYDQLSESEGFRSLFQKVFDNFQGATAYGGTLGNSPAGDLDATPE